MEVFDSNRIKSLLKETGSALPEAVQAACLLKFKDFLKQYRDSSNSFITRNKATITQNGEKPSQLHLCLGTPGSGIDEYMEAIKRTHKVVPIQTKRLREEIMETIVHAIDADNGFHLDEKQIYEIAENYRIAAARTLMNEVSQHETRPSVAYPCLPGSILKKTDNPIDCLANLSSIEVHIRAFFGPLRNVAEKAQSQNIDGDATFKDHIKLPKAIIRCLEEMPCTSFEILWLDETGKPKTVITTKPSSGEFQIVDQDLYRKLLKEIGEIDRNEKVLYEQIFGKANSIAAHAEMAPSTQQLEPT